MSRHGKFRILLVNQFPKTTRAFQEAARSAGAELTSVGTFEQAGLRVREERYEAIFIDPNLPNFSRQGFARLVHLSPLNSRTPVVLIVSAYAEEARKAELPKGFIMMARPSQAADLYAYLDELRQKLLADRRKDRRLDYRTSVNCLQAGRRLRATTLNLSTTGVLLQLSWVPRLGDDLELHFPLGDNVPEFQAHGRVVRLEGPGRAALNFQNLRPFDRERIRQFVDTHLPDIR